MFVMQVLIPSLFLQKVAITRNLGPYSTAKLRFQVRKDETEHSKHLFREYKVQKKLKYKTFPYLHLRSPYLSNVIEYGPGFDAQSVSFYW